MPYKEKISGIYKIENIINGNVYIGQSKDVRNRMYSHKSELKKNKHCNIHLQRAWNKYGEDNFKFIILEECNQEEIDQKEIIYINKYNSYKNGYNRDLGGKCGNVHSEETIIKLKKSKENISDEIRENMRYAQKSIPIYQIDLNGNVINQWYSIREASKILDISFSCIWDCVNKKRRTYKNYIWITKDDYDNGCFNLNNYINQNTQPKNIIQLDKQYNFIKSWGSANQTHRELNYDSSSIIKCCKNKIKTAYGFKWMYKEDYDNLVS